MTRSRLGAGFALAVLLSFAALAGPTPSPPPDASPSVRGLVNTKAQVFGGTKTFDGGVLLPNGSLSAPSIAFAGDTDTGFWWQQSGGLVFSANGVRQLRSNGSSLLYLATDALWMDVANGGFGNAQGAGLSLTTQPEVLVSGSPLKVTGAYTSGGLSAGAPSWLGSYNGSTDSAWWVTTPGATNFTLRGNAGGATYLNGFAGQPINFTQAGSTVATLSSDGTFTGPGVVCSASTCKGLKTLAAGTGTVTVLSGAVCVCSLSTSAGTAAPKCNVSGTTLTITGTGTDVIAYHCL